MGEERIKIKKFPLFVVSDKQDTYTTFQSTFNLSSMRPARLANKNSLEPNLVHARPKSITSDEIFKSNHEHHPYAQHEVPRLSHFFRGYQSLCARGPGVLGYPRCHLFSRPSHWTTLLVAVNLKSVRLVEKPTSPH